MTEAQETLAKELLREGLDWIGMTELTEAEELLAVGVSERIERLLLDLGVLKRGRSPRCSLA